jgi:hypothetical protein
MSHLIRPDGSGADAEISNHGSIVILTPLTEPARAWISENLPGDVMRWAGGIVIEPRYIGPIVDGMIADGLEVSE